MSTVFYGFVVKKKNWPKARLALRNLALDQLHKTFPIEKLNDQSADERITALVDIKREMIDKFLTSDVQLFEIGNVFYGRIIEHGYGMMNKVWDKMRDWPFIREFSYDDRSDPPENVSNLVLNRRRKLVNVLDEMVTERNYFVVPLVDSMDISEWIVQSPYIFFLRMMESKWVCRHA